VDDLLEAEANEDIIRLDRSATESAAVAADLRQREAEHAQARMLAGKASHAVGETSTKVAAKVGNARKTLERAEAVVAVIGAA
jgi:hypothetical protein